MPRSIAPRSTIAQQAANYNRSHIVLASITSVVAVAATTGVVVLISVLPAGDLEVITGLVGLLN